MAAQALAQQQAQQQALIDSQRAAISSQISALNTEKTLLQEVAKLRLDALREELRIVQGLTDFFKDIGKNILDLQLSPQGINTVSQRLAIAQGEINSLFSSLLSATEAEKLTIGKDIQSLINTLFSLSGEAFQQPSLEFRDSFRGVIAQLEKLQEMVGPTRSIEEINASIEEIERQSQQMLASIDAGIEALQQKSSQLQQASNVLTGQIAQDILELKEFLRDEAIKLLDLRLEQLSEVTENVGMTEIEILDEHIMLSVWTGFLF